MQTFSQFGIADINWLHYKSELGKEGAWTRSPGGCSSFRLLSGGSAQVSWGAGEIPGFHPFRKIRGLGDTSSNLTKFWGEFLPFSWAPIHSRNSWMSSHFAILPPLTPFCKIATWLTFCKNCHLTHILQNCHLWPPFPDIGHPGQLALKWFPDIYVSTRTKFVIYAIELWIYTQKSNKFVTNSTN